MRTILFALVVATTACGKVTTKPGDNGDGGTGDGTPNDGKIAIVITVMDAASGREPAPHTPVVLTAPDGSTETLFTEIDGTLATRIVPKTAVTAIWRTDVTNAMLFTAYDVESDHLTLRPYYSSASILLGQVKLTAPSAPGATQYSISDDCTSNSSATTSVDFVEISDCRGDKHAYTVTYSAGNVQTGFLEVKDVPAGDATLTGTYSTFSTFNYQLSNLDPTVDSSIAVIRYPGDTTFYENGNSATVTTTTMADSFTSPMGGNAHLLVQDYLQTVMAAPMIYKYGSDNIYQKLGGNTFAYNLDLGANRPPFVEHITFDGTRTKLVSDATVDPGPLVSAYADLAYRSQTLPASDAGTPENVSIRWRAVMPAMPTSAAPRDLPALPAEYAALRPNAMSTMQPYSNYEIMRGTGVDYATVSTDYFANFNDHARLAAILDKAGSNLVIWQQLYYEDDNAPPPPTP